MRENGIQFESLPQARQQVLQHHAQPCSLHGHEPGNLHGQGQPVVPQGSRTATARATISVVMPTCGRSPWLDLAIESVLKQSYAPVELIVVDDRPQAETEELCKAMALLEADARPACNPEVSSQSCATEDAEHAVPLRIPIRWLRTYGAGAAFARNAGVQAATGDWIAFLDDDDAWQPEKLARQMESALASEALYPVLSCRMLVQTATAEYELPRQSYDGREPLAEYLFCRKGLRAGKGWVQTSTLLAPRALLLAEPWNAALKLHQDWDWLLRVTARHDVGLRMLDVPLAVYRTEDGRATISRRPDWRASLDWIRSQHKRVSPRAAGWFIAVECVWRARAAHARWREWGVLLRDFFTEGRMTAGAGLAFAAFALFPVDWRKRLRNRCWSQPANPGPFKRWGRWNGTLFFIRKSGVS